MEVKTDYIVDGILFEKTDPEQEKKNAERLKAYADKVAKDSEKEEN